MEKIVKILAVLVFVCPLVLHAEDKEHGGFMFRFIGQGGGGAATEVSATSGTSIETVKVSTLAHDYRFDFGYSFNQYVALHVGIWGRYIHDGKSRPLQQFTGIPIGLTFFLPGNWYISPMFMYDLRRNDLSTIQQTFNSVINEATANTRPAAIAGVTAGIAGAEIPNTGGMTTLQGISGAITAAGGDAATATAAATAGLAAAVNQASNTTPLAINGVTGVATEALTQAGITGAAATAGATAIAAAVTNTNAASNIAQTVNTAATAARTGIIAANSGYLDSAGQATTHAAFRPRGLSYGLEIGWENPTNEDWGFGVGLRYWRLFSSYEIVVNIPTPTGNVAQTFNYNARDDLFGFTISATLN